MNENLLRRAAEFIDANKLGVISTTCLNSSSPESALVGVTRVRDLQLVFGTSSKTRKYENLIKNPGVSFVIGSEPAIGTLQYEGVATEIPKEEEGQYVSLHIAKNPGAAKFSADPDQRYFLVKPTWIRLTDNRQPASVEELVVGSTTEEG